MTNTKIIRVVVILSLALLCFSVFYFIAKDPQCQIWLYSHQIEGAPDQSRDAYYKRGIAYSKRHQYDLAISDYSKAIELEPKKEDAYVSRGIAYANIGKINLALEDFTKAIELNATMPEAYNNRGGMYFVKGEYQKAVEDCTKAIEIVGDAKSFLLRGNAYVGLKEYEKAISDYQQALRTNQDLVQVYFELGAVYEKKQQHKEALNAYNEFIKNAALSDQRIAQAKERIKGLQ